MLQNVRSLDVNRAMRWKWLDVPSDIRTARCLISYLRNFVIEEIRSAGKSRISHVFVEQIKNDKLSHKP